jgi:dienelactone hydrolase
MIATLVLASLLAAAAAPSPAPGAPIEVEVHQGSVVGRFARPPDPGRHGAVIVLGGFGGGIPDGAFDFARLGYATLALAYFGTGPLPKNLDQVPVETVTRAVDWLVTVPEVDTSRIAVVGISNGSALALIGAALDPRIKAVAVVSPTAYVWFAPVFDGGYVRSAWTVNKTQLAFIPPDETAVGGLVTAFRDGGSYAFRDLYDASLAAAPAATVASATIPVERIGGPILCIAGDADRQWNSAGACATIAARRKAAQRDAHDQVTIERGAGHALSVDGHAAPTQLPAGKVQVQLGGTLDANARAAADERAQVLSFLSRAL